MIWATVSFWSCFCWLYRASTSLAAKNIISLIFVLTIWWCPCVESSLVLWKGCLLWPVHFLGKTLLVFALLHSVFQGQICLYSWCFLTSYFCIPEGNGTPLPYSCLENPMDGGAWWAPGGSMGSLRVGHDWATSLSLFTFMHWRRKWQPIPVFLPGESQGNGWGQEAWLAAVHGVTKSCTWLRDWTGTTMIHLTLFTSIKTLPPQTVTLGG